MLLNNLKFSFRQLMKNKTFTFINIFGLTTGFLCFTLLALYIHDEVNFDLFHRDADKTYRVLQHEKQEDGTLRKVAPVASLIGKEAVTQFPEVESVCRMFVLGRVTMGNDPANRGYERILSTDDNFFTFFDFPLIEGDPATVLKNPDGVVLTESLARKYFGNEKAFGKRIWTSFYRNDKPVEFTVTGIMHDFPKNSHMQIDLIFSESSWPAQFRWYTEFVSSDWTSNSYVTYLKLASGTNIASLSEKMTSLVKKNYPPDDEFKSNFTLQPLRDIHMYSENIQGNELNANGIKPFYLYMFAAVGFLLLLIACLNYMNLSTAAAFKRTREIGTRKTLGARKTQLIGQFISDSLVLSCSSLVLAFVILQSILPFVNQFTQKELSLGFLSAEWLMMIVGIMIAAGILSAFYPAFVTAQVSPAEAIKKEIKIANKSLPVRKVLVVAQFTISIIMIASTLVIYRQLEFMRSKDLGFETESLLVIDINSDRLRRNFENVKAEFAKPSEVLQISTSTRVPGEWKTFPIAHVKPMGEPQGEEMIYVGIDNDFLKTYDIELKEGRNFSVDPADSTKVILTELAVQQLGLKDPIGQVIEIPTIRWGGSIENLDRVFTAEVIGIAENFHFESLRSDMRPVIFAAPNTPIQRIDYYTLKIKTSDWPATLNRLKEINTVIDPNNPIEYTFLESRFKDFYKADEQRGQVFLTFSLIIVLIACLGLFALVSYSVESRTKEIGIRKVMGATVTNIVGMMSKEFLLLVVFACGLAIPVSYFFMQEWLQDFAYHINMGAGTFIAASLLTILIAWITISLRSVKAAVANPVNSLRSE
ncbi:MAG: ABC transporter permease [Flammeovirgaceae bacterium]|nr:ABC transporter permease [Flammeovirgaceae bacterium]